MAARGGKAEGGSGARGHCSGGAGQVWRGGGGGGSRGLDVCGVEGRPEDGEDKVREWVGSSKRLAMDRAEDRVGRERVWRCAELEGEVRPVVRVMRRHTCVAAARREHAAGGDALVVEERQDAWKMGVRRGRVGRAIAAEALRRRAAAAAQQPQRVRGADAHDHRQAAARGGGGGGEGGEEGRRV